MDNEIPSWLPNLVLHEDYKDWSLYFNKIYEHYENDFVKSHPLFKKSRVFVRHEPAHENKGATFWHLISEGKEESERLPNLSRCERIRWPKFLIEAEEIKDVKIWETFRSRKGQKDRRINISIKNFSYLVVIAKTAKGYTLVTAYPIEKKDRREKLKKEFETSY